MYTIEYIAKNTSLKVSYIRKCIKTCENILKPYYEKKEFNRIYFSDGGLAIFRRIRELHEQGYTIGKIQKKLDSELLNQNQNTAETNKTEIERLLEKIEKLQNELNSEKDNNRQEIQIKETRIFELENIQASFLLLTDGKNPSDLKKEWDQERVNKVSRDFLLKELDSLNFLNIFKKKRLIKEIRALDKKT